VSGPRAAIDVGSNSVRLLVVDDAGRPLARELTITRLGTAVDRTGHLDDAAMLRTLDTLARYRDHWRALGVSDRVRIAATSAARDASDRDRLLEGVRAATGVDAEVLSGDAEAALSFLGATGALQVAAPTAVADIGGGSTELIVGDATSIDASVSLQLGSVRVTERHLHDDPPAPAQLAAAREMVALQLDHADAALAAAGAPLHGAAALVAVAGTATTLGALRLHLDAGAAAAAAADRRPADRGMAGVHGLRIAAAALWEISNRLAAMTTAERAALGPVPAGREDVIHAGALILATVVERYGFPEVVISEADNLDALAASLL